MEKEKYQINFGSHLANLSGLAIHFAVYIVLLLYVNLKGTYNAELLLGFNWFVVVMMSIEFLIVISIHLNYYSVNKSDTLFYEKNQESFTFKKNNRSISFSNEDISSVDFYRFAAPTFQIMRFMASDTYSHIDINLNNGVTIVITSLLIGGDIELPMVNENKIHDKINFFRWAKSPSMNAGILN